MPAFDAEPSKKPDLIRWAHDQGPDFPLAHRFADAVTQGCVIGD